LVKQATGRLGAAILTVTATRVRNEGAAS
jgi:hypothetical protein